MLHISEELLKELLVDKGYNDNQAADFLGVSKSSISRRRAALGIQAKPKHFSTSVKMSSEKNEELLRYYSEGKNDYEIAELMHMSRNTLRVWRLKNDISSQSNKVGLGKQDAVDMYDLYCSGENFEQISKKYNISRTSVSKHIKKWGYEVEDKRTLPSEETLNRSLKSYQEQVLIGELFGDGGIFCTSNKKAFYYYAQSNNQDFFTIWKYHIFKDVIVNVHTKKDSSSVRVATWSIPYFKKWYDIFYPDGSKNLTDNLVEYLDPISLAVWYMGDGSLNKKTPTIHVGLSIDLIPIARALTIKFDLLFEAIPYEKEWHLKIREPLKFFEIISPFCIKGFEYKFYEVYRDKLSSGWEGNSRPDITPEQYHKLSEDKKNEILDLFVSFYIKRGFPYPRYNRSVIKKEVKALCAVDTIIVKNTIYNNNLCNRVCNHYFPHRFDGSRYDSDPMSIWKDEKSLRKFFINRFKYAEGTITDSVIRTGIQLKGVPANFSPSVAKYIYQKYLPRGGVTIDFSSGYGARLMGFMASGMDGLYVGIEPYTKSYNGLNKMADECASIIGIDRSQIVIVNEPFEDCACNFSSDLIFSSPPYFGLELYTDEGTQSIKRYPDYSLWLKNFWTLLVDKCVGSLSPGGHFIYSIGNYKGYDLIGDTLKIIKRVGLKHCDTFNISYHNVFKNLDKLESVFVFKK